MTTKKQIADRIERINAKLRILCKSNIAVEYNFPALTILKDGRQLRGDQPDGEYFSCYDSQYFFFTKPEVYTALQRAEKFLYAREAGAGDNASHIISDRELCGIFGASFWK